ncbi:MAG: TIGR03905 family TSCPD domain-containing protein [Odoribacter sp.]|nr:TIGR03905 family TSCPD domain-containing protein [Odoribacter sp.]
MHYIPAGVCSQTIDITVEDGIVKEVYFEGGCHGNLQGISLLVKGMKIGEVINRLEGIHCGYKNTSCPDQFAKALRILEQK